jgi:hypothetical protein
MKVPMEHGEYPLGSYKIRFARFTPLGWEMRGSWMRAIVTNQRVVFMPDVLEDTQAAHSPTSIARMEMRLAWNVCLGRRDGAILALQNGQLVYLYVEWSQGAKLVRDIHEMLAPPVQPRILPRMTHSAKL